MSFKWEYRNKNCIRYYSCYVTVKNGYIFLCFENQSEIEFKSNRLIYLKQEILGCRMVIIYNFQLDLQEEIKVRRYDKCIFY